MMKITTTDILNHIVQQEEEKVFLMGKAEALEEQIELLQKIILNVEWINPEILELEREIYSGKEIKDAFFKAKVYEGLATNEFDSVLDTFIDFLEGAKK